MAVDDVALDADHVLSAVADFVAVVDEKSFLARISLFRMRPSLEEIFFGLLVFLSDLQSFALFDFILF